MEEAKKLSHPSVEALDQMLGIPHKVLDDGFVRVVDYMGSDASIVQAARVSYGEGTKQIHEDKGLIRYLMRHRHTTPFEMCEIKLHVRVPMDCWRQWIRHRTANVNEYSTRYSLAIDSAQKTDPSQWRIQGKGNRQGSEGYLETTKGEILSAEEEDLQKMSRKIYETRIQFEVAREQARKDLPLSTYTEAYWKVDLHNLLNFLSLRMEAHAQEEIRAYATTVGENIVAAWCPLTWEAFLDYRMNAVSFSRPELEILTWLNKGNKEKAVDSAKKNGWLEQGEKGLKSHRERSECEEKFKKMGYEIPW